MGIEKRRSTLCVLFYIKRQKLLKNGEAPVCMRITVDKRKAEIVIKRSVPVENEERLHEYKNRINLKSLIKNRLCMT